MQLNVAAAATATSLANVEAGSASDSYRGGKRKIVAAITEFTLPLTWELGHGGWSTSYLV